MLSGQNSQLYSLPAGISGSASALSLISTPERMVAMGVGAGVAVAVVASVSIYRAVEDYMEKKHLEEIKAINALHKRYLSKIVLFNKHDFQGLPVIFQFGDKEKASEVSCLRFNDDEVEEIGKHMAQLPDIGLRVYRLEIQDAIRLLKGFYRERKKMFLGHENKKKEQDNTSAVLSYLMYILQTYCLNWEGYDIDIAYLDALYKFIREYASMAKTQNDVHFSRLEEVNKHIKNALEELRQRQLKLTMKDHLNELVECTSFNVDKLLRNFIRLITPVKNWDFIDHAAYDQLIRGKLRRQYTKRQLLGYTVALDFEKKIPESIFRAWSEMLAEYFYQSVNPDVIPDKRLMQKTERLFKVPDLNVLHSLQDKKYKFKKMSKQESKQLDGMEQDLKDIKSVFHQAQHFLSVELDPKTLDKDPKYVPITNDDKTILRANVIASIAALIHKIISMQYLCIHIVKSKDQLGELYLSNPEHFKNVFATLECLDKDISAATNDVFDKFKMLDRDNKNYMQMNESLKDDLVNYLDSVKSSISLLCAKIIKYRDDVKLHPDADRPTKQSVMHEMFATVETVAAMYGYQSLPAAEEVVTQPKEDDTLEEVRSPDAIRAAPSVVPEAPQFMPDDHESQMKAIENKLSQIRDRIIYLKNEADQNEIRSYDVLRRDLAAFAHHVDTMEHESNKSPERKEKIKRLTNILFQVSNDTLIYLNSANSERKRLASAFSQQIKSILHDKDNQAIDDHKHVVKKKVNKLFSLFTTTTRKRANALEKDCQSIVQGIPR